MKKYFAVETKCGHVGRTRCIWIKFAIYADSAKEAAHKAKELGRVKRQHIDVIKSVEEISFEEFMTLRAQNDADKYLHCKNIQEQRQIDGFDDRVEVDEYNISKNAKKHTKKDSLEYRVKKTQSKEKSDKKFIREYLMEEVVA